MYLLAVLRIDIGIHRGTLSTGLFGERKKNFVSFQYFDGGLIIFEHIDSLSQTRNNETAEMIFSAVSLLSLCGYCSTTRTEISPDESTRTVPPTSTRSEKSSCTPRTTPSNASSPRVQRTVCPV